MTIEDVNKVIEDIEKDITYFSNLEFKTITEKFRRDLKIIKELAKN